MQPGTAIKRFVKCEEWQPPDIAAQREWRALALVDKYAPGLAPTPVEADLAGPEPTVIMSRLAGTPLRGSSVRPEQLTAMARLSSPCTRPSRRTRSQVSRRESGPSAWPSRRSARGVTGWDSSRQARLWLPRRVQAWRGLPGRSWSGQASRMCHRYSVRRTGTWKTSSGMDRGSGSSISSTQAAAIELASSAAT